MNRQDTIRALKICSGQKPCAQCPLNDYSTDSDICKQKLMEDALSVLERNTQYHRNTTRVKLRSVVNRMTELLKNRCYFAVDGCDNKILSHRIIDERDLDAVTKQLLEEVK